MQHSTASVAGQAKRWSLCPLSDIQKLFVSSLKLPTTMPSLDDLQFSLSIYLLIYLSLLITTRSELRKFCFWRRQSVVFCLCMKYLGNCWTDLRQIRVQGVFGPSLGWVWRSKSKIKSQGHQGQKTTTFSALSAACARFMFGKISLASSLFDHLFLYRVGQNYIYWIHIINGTAQAKMKWFPNSCQSSWRLLRGCMRVWSENRLCLG